MKRFWLQCISISVFVFFMLWMANKVTDFKIFTAFDTIGAAMKDFQLTDYAFSKLRPDPTVDERIILVNFGTIPRRDLARQLMMLNQFKPKVIGIDGFYNCEGGLRDTLNCPQLLDTLGNLMLSSAIQDAGNVVLATKLMQSDSLSRFDIDVYDSIEYADPIFMDYSKPGFVSLPTDASYQEDVKLCRSLYPKVNVNGQDELAFSVQIAMMYDSVKTKKFLARDNVEELINFRGNIEVQRFRFMTEKTRDENNITASSNFKTMFYVIDAEELLRGDFLPEVIKGNIVMIGFLGDYLGDPSWEDKFFTPLNSKVAGRANPDMFGLVVHANAVAMILNEDYINQLAGWGQYLVAFMVCLLTVALFIVMDRKLPMWFDGLSVLVQLFELLLISVFMIQAFTWWDLKLDLTVAIGVSALVGPCYDIFKSLQIEVTKRLTKRKQSVLNTVNQ